MERTERSDERSYEVVVEVLTKRRRATNFMALGWCRQ